MRQKLKRVDFAGALVLVTCVFSLLFGSLAKPIGRNWKFAPRLIKLFISVSEADRPSIQKLVANASFTIQDMTKAMDRMVILDQATLNAIWPQDAAQVEVGRTIAVTMEEANGFVPAKKERVKKRRAVIEGKKKELAKELLQMVKTSHECTAECAHNICAGKV